MWNVGRVNLIGWTLEYTAKKLPNATANTSISTWTGLRWNLDLELQWLTAWMMPNSWLLHNDIVVDNQCNLVYITLSTTMASLKERIVKEFHYSWMNSTDVSGFKLWCICLHFHESYALPPRCRKFLLAATHVTIFNGV
jgi:hypothetical protein